MSAVLIASITELCVADHNNDPEALRGWLANKTPESVAEWFTSRSSTILVAECDGEVAAVGAYNPAREITLNYVSPRHRFAGVSKAMLAALEAGLGPGEARLDATKTARQFYAAAVWEGNATPQSHGGITCFAMRKLLR